MVEKTKKEKMITGTDLMNIYFFLSLQESIVNQTEERKKIINDLRAKIHIEMEKIKIKIKK